jgi:adenylosuccinate lyase
MSHAIANILAERYATPPLRAIWSAEGRVRLERELWIAVMRAQSELGIEIPQDAIDAYEKVVDKVDLESIAARERVTRHDVKARIEEFCDLAGYQHIHKGMTSRDLTENVEQLQVFRSLREIRKKAVASLDLLAERVGQWKGLVITARTHNVAAQTTTFGRRLAMFGEELLLALRHLDELIACYPVRGLKGAVGTQQDQLTLFGGDSEKVSRLDAGLRGFLGIPRAFEVPGQVYGRSLDFRVVSLLVELGSAPASFAKTLRIMAGHELASEGFAKGQVGSSAMPHKMNSRSCERINGFHTILKGHAVMAAGLAGDQWNEGDVSCSVVRRVFLPDAFFAIDGLLETFLTVLAQMEVFEGVIEQENAHYFPFLLTTTFLMEAVRGGVGREQAHEAIKEHAVATVLDLRNGAVAENDLLERLAGDARLGMSRAKLSELLEAGKAQAGTAAAQIQAFLGAVEEIRASDPEAAAYRAGAIL